MKRSEKKWLIAGGTILGILLLAGRARGASGGSAGVATLSYLGTAGLPLGMGRNNPGNIVRGIGYQGEVFEDNGRFAQFQTWAYGIRAMIVLLRKYITSGSSYPNPCVTTPQNTIRLIILQWSPKASCGGDNPDAAVEKYIDIVSSKTGIGQNAILKADQNTLRKLVIAMSAVEQGRPCVTTEQFNYAYTLA